MTDLNAPTHQSEDQVQILLQLQGEHLALQNLSRLKKRRQFLCILYVNTHGSFHEMGAICAILEYVVLNET